MLPPPLALEAATSLLTKSRASERTPTGAAIYEVVAMIVVIVVVGKGKG